MGAPYEWIEHTGELELQVEAGSREGAFVEAAMALGELLAEHERDVPEEARGAPGSERAPEAGARTRTFEVSVSAPDDPTLLAEWLSELVYHSEAAGLIPVGVERIELSDGIVEASVAARPGVPSPLVKAVTYHRLELRGEGGRWRARVVLDV